MTKYYFDIEKKCVFSIEVSKATETYENKNGFIYNLTKNKKDILLQAIKSIEDDSKALLNEIGMNLSLIAKFSNELSSEEETIK